MSDRATERVRACLRLAAHPSTGEGERDAAMDRAMALIERHGLDPDRFDIPGRARQRPEPLDPDVAMHDASSGLGAIFGTCAGCGAVSTRFATCRACAVKAESQTCHHGRHGYCPECEDVTEALNA